MKVRLFGGLRNLVGANELSASGHTIREVLLAICAAHEALGDAILASDRGALQPHVRVMVNGIDSELVKGLETPVSEDDQLAIFPPLAGG